MVIFLFIKSSAGDGILLLTGVALIFMSAMFIFCPLFMHFLIIGFNHPIYLSIKPFD